jgi:hypothetical protein
MKRASAFCNPLTRLANKYGSDKGNLVHGAHNYTRVYNQVLRGLRQKKISLLEIGLLHPLEGIPKGRAPSMQMWREYFPHAELTGFDLRDFSNVSIRNCKIIQGDAGNQDDLLKVSDRAPFNVVIDDASHASHHQQIALGTLFRFVSPEGIYIIEDLHWQPPNDLPPKTIEVLRRILATGLIDSPHFAPQQATYLRDHIASIEFYDSQDAFVTNKTNALAIIRKR